MCVQAIPVSESCVSVLSTLVCGRRGGVEAVCPLPLLHCVLDWVAHGLRAGASPGVQHLSVCALHLLTEIARAKHVTPEGAAVVLEAGNRIAAGLQVCPPPLPSPPLPHPQWLCRWARPMWPARVWPPKPCLPL